MPPTQDPKLLAVLLWGTFAVVALLLTVLAYLLRQALARWGAKLDAIERSVSELAGKVTSHEERLRGGGDEFARIRDDIKGLRDREMQRACFGPCRAGGA